MTAARLDRPCRERTGCCGDADLRCSPRRPTGEICLRGILAGVSGRQNGIQIVPELRNEADRDRESCSASGSVGLKGITHGRNRSLDLQ